MESQSTQNSTRQAAILVADIAGISMLPDENDPGGITGPLTRFADTCESVITLYGGKIERESGERIMAFFGLDDNRDSYSLQAVQAALELRSRVNLMTADQDLPEGAGLRAGIASGEVIAGVIGTGKNRRYTVIGSPVELASRIQDLAEAGQILAGPEIILQTQQQFEFRALEPMHLKGQKKPVAVYELSGKKREVKAASVESTRMIASIMVGREQEVRKIEELIKQLLNGRGGVLNIEGTAGIGKSRLIAEIKNREIIGNIAYFEGRALSEGKNLSFHPIIQVVKSWAGITDNDNQAASFQKLSKNIHRIYPEQAAEIIPFVATMMGYPLEGELRQRVAGIEGESLEKLILKNTRDLLSRAASIRPIAIMVEDAHWADLSSISFMDSLFKLARNHRLLFINVFRPGYKDTGDHLKSFVKENLPEHGREIILKPLTREESEELIGNLLNQTDLPEDIKNLIVQRSEGNPFFIEEVIRSFLDEGLVEVKDQRFVVTEQIQYANIPETIDKVILSRIERLDEKTKSLLKTASVIGRNFYYKVLEEAARTIEELDSRLEYLKETQLLNESKHKEDVEFLFKHALAQQATYDSILQKTKKELHLKIARSIEKVFAEKIHEFYGILAMHYGKAEMPEKVEEYLFKAGEQSLAAGASSEAVNYFKDALEAYLNSHRKDADPQKVIEIEEKIGISLQTKGENIEAVEYFDKVLEFYNFRVPKNKRIKIIKALLYFFIFMLMVRNEKLLRRKKSEKNMEKILRMMIYKGEALATINTQRWFIESIYALQMYLKIDISAFQYTAGMLSSSSTFYTWTGLSLSTGRIMLEKAEKIISDNENYFKYNYRMSKILYDYVAGNWMEDLDQEAIINNGLRIGAIWEVIIYLTYCGLINIDKGVKERAFRFIEKLNELSENFENSHAKAQAFRVASINYVRYRLIREGISVMDDGIKYTLKTGHLAMLMVIYSQKSIAHSMIGEMEEARKCLLEAEKLVKERKLIKVYHSGYLLATCYLELSKYQKDAIKTKQHLRCLMKLTHALIRSSKVIYSNNVEGYRLRAITYWYLNNQNKSFRNFEKAIEIAERYGTRPELARTYFELGKCLMDQKSRHKIIRSKNGSEYLLMAKRMFEEMDLQWDLQEYERYMEG